MGVLYAKQRAYRLRNGLRAAKFAIGLLCSTFGVTASDGVAQTVPDFFPERNAAERPFSDALETGYLAIEREILAGRLDQARYALQPLLAAETNSYQAKFLLAEIERRSGHLEVAIRIYGEILAADPSLDRVRLELAVTLIAVGRDSDAERELFVVLRHSPPGIVSAHIRNVLAAIDHRRAFIWSGGVAIVGDSNANVAPRDRTVMIFDLPFELSDESREQSGVGLSTFAAAKWRPPLTRDLRLRLGVALFALDYPGIRFDQTGAKAALGPQLLRERWNASLLLVGMSRGYGGEPYSSSYGLRSEAIWSPQERIALQFAGDFQYASYARFRPLRKPRGIVSPLAGMRWAFSSKPVR